MVAYVGRHLSAIGGLVDHPWSRWSHTKLPCQHRGIYLTHLHDWFQMASETVNQVVGSHGRPVCGRTVSNQFLRSSYGHDVPTLVLNLYPGDINVNCNDCMHMHQIGFTWPTGDMLFLLCSCFTGQMDNNMSMNIDMSDIHMRAVRKSTNLVEVLLWLVANFSWLWPCLKILCNLVIYIWIPKSKNLWSTLL